MQNLGPLIQRKTYATLADALYVAQLAVDIGYRVKCGKLAGVAYVEWYGR